MYTIDILRKRFKVSYKTRNVTFLFEDEKADLFCTFQFSLKCLAEDINYEPIIQALIMKIFQIFILVLDVRKKFLIQMYFS